MEILAPKWSCFLKLWQNLPFASSSFSSCSSSSPFFSPPASSHLSSSSCSSSSCSSSSPDLAQVGEGRSRREGRPTLVKQKRSIQVWNDVVWSGESQSKIPMVFYVTKWKDLLLCNCLAGIAANRTRPGNENGQHCTMCTLGSIGFHLRWK